MKNFPKYLDTFERRTKLMRTEDLLILRNCLLQEINVRLEK